MGIQKIISASGSISKQGLKKASCVTPSCKIVSASELGLNLKQLNSDNVQISNKHHFSEAINYFKAVEKEGRGYKPVFDNPDSPFAQYYAFTQNGPFRRIPNINNYKTFIFENADKLSVTKDEYYFMIDELSKIAKDKLLLNSSIKVIRQEFIDNADNIHKWAEIFATQHQFPDGTVKYNKFYDKEIYNQAVKEYTEFVEKLTGKKVLIGCVSRMNFPISALGLLNNPNAYKDVDYILLGHGKNSSLITDIMHPNTWRFTDNDKSIWEFIEQNVPKGKRVLVFSCETRGVSKAIEAGVISQEEVDCIHKILPCVGNTVSGWFDVNGAAKICESGKRKIIGQVSDSSKNRSLIITSVGNVYTYGKNGTFELCPIIEPEIRFMH